MNNPLCQFVNEMDEGSRNPKILKYIEYRILLSTEIFKIKGNCTAEILMVFPKKTKGLTSYVRVKCEFGVQR